MEEFDILYKVIFSIGLGFIVGLEREYKAKEDIFAGVRTYPLISLLGFLSSYISDQYWQGAVYISFLAVAIFTVFNFYLEYSKDKGITTEISVLITFLIGVLVYHNQLYISGFVAITLMFILAIKKPLENFAKNLYYEDIISIVKFLALTALIYPILPDRYFGPFEFFNPKEIWKVVIIVAIIDFIGYILLRWKGQKSLLLVGLLGGLISSTAVTYDFSKLSKQINSVNLYLGIALAWFVMNLRVMLLSVFVNVNMLMYILPPFFIFSVIYALIIFRDFSKHRDEFTEYKQIRNPFSILSVLQFGVIYTFIVFLVKVLSFYYGQTGLYILSLISGFIDVDAITLSVSNMAKSGTISEISATIAVILAVISNSFFKYFYVVIFGESWLKKKMVKILVITAGYFLIYLTINII
ncbi:MAG: MgtC/SapB family protein [Hydrogenothermaceae bacterium]